MALSVPRSAIQNMMKDGAKSFSGLEEAVYRNIEACRQLTKILRSSYGPNGMNKMVINHLDKLFVTSDAATMLHELEVQHPAAKMLLFASQMQEQEVGDGTNWVLIFSGALLNSAEGLLKMGLSPAEVIEGYNMACKKALEILPELVCSTLKDLRDPVLVAKALNPVICSKQYGNEEFLSELITKACLSVYPINGNFNVDSVRVAKIAGSGIFSSEVINGMIFRRDVEGDITSANDAKICVISCPLDSMATETKGTVLIKNAEELMDFSKGEEDLLEQQIKSIADSGCNVIVTGGKAADMAIHFCNKYKIMVVRLMSKFDLRRLCRATQSTALPQICAPTPEEAGKCSSVSLAEIGDTNVVIFRQDRQDSAVATVVIRGATSNMMDDIERAVDDGVNCFKALTRDQRLLPGAGAFEMELAQRIAKYGQTIPGLEQYAIKKFSEAFEIFPRTMAENAGVKATELISNLYAAHNSGEQNIGFNIEGEGAAVKDVNEAGILDSFLVKYWGLKFSNDAACTVLRVDQIIMAKQAGGPKPKANPDWDED
jgi:T-complex protein 1 subunit theta